MQERAQQTRANILKAAEEQFSLRGFYGARVDDIASKAGVNKVLLYKYFGNKEELYKTVFGIVYNRFTLLEQSVLQPDNLNYEDKIRKFVAMEFDFCRKNESYVRMIMWENLHGAKEISGLITETSKQPVLELVREILRQSGAKVDEHDFLITLYSLCFFYFTNMNTMSRITGKVLSDEQNIRHRVENVSDILISYLKECR